MTHLTAEQLSALADNALAAPARAEAERHLAACATCREALADVMAQDEAMASALVHDPGDAYFDTFAARVEDRIRAGGMSGAQQRVGSRGLAGWFRSPRKLAWVGGLAALVAGAGIVLLTSREIRVPDLREPELANRGGQVSAPSADRSPAPEAEPTAPSTSRMMDAPRTQARAPGDAGPVAEQMRGATPVVRSQQVAPDNFGDRAGAPAAPAPAATAKDATPPARAHEVRRNELGEDVPVRSPNERTFAAPPPAERQSQPSNGPVRVMKPRYAEPLAAAQAGESTAAAAKKEAETGATTGLATSDSRTRNLTFSTLDKTATGAAGDIITESQQTAPAFESLPIYSASIARNAQRLTAVAERLKSASGYDAAAVEWTRLLGHVKGGPLEQETRWQIAVTRFNAWQTGDSGSRASRARDALTSYLAIAIPGARRDQAEKWLELVRVK